MSWLSKIREPYVAIVVAPLPTVQVKGTCPTGWVTGSTKCFKIVTSGPLAFAEAHLTCGKVINIVTLFAMTEAPSIVSK